MAQQHLHSTQVQVLREATPFGQAPRFLIRDRDSKWVAILQEPAQAAGINVRCTAAGTLRITGCNCANRLE
ncbi:MAG: hypothetical protein M1132_00635 [Chloroflexi bacterium]|nr:hypothetical protein [Chloroflexota bacterium]